MIVLFDRGNSGRNVNVNVMHDMHLLKTYPKGTVLFSQPTQDGKRSIMKGIPWEVEIWLDNPKGVPPPPPVLPPPPRPPMQLGTLGKGDPIMTFSGTINGAPALMLADSGATFSIFDSSYAEQHGLVARPANREVQLADGSTKYITKQYTVKIRMRGHTSQITCFSLDMDQQFDLILGQDLSGHIR